LKEKYDIVLEVQAPADPSDSELGPRVSDAVSRLGLRLKPAKVPVEVLVIDNVTKMPTPN
jgi:uncharacterized protein (TIGR03435 family)